MGSAVAQHFGESTPADPQHPYRGMLVYFGYRLSSVCLVNADTIGGSDELSLGRGSKVKLSKVGPGVLFAILGAGLIAHSFAKPMKINIPATPQPRQAPQAHQN